MLTPNIARATVLPTALVDSHSKGVGSKHAALPHARVNGEPVTKQFIVSVNVTTDFLLVVMKLVRSFHALYYSHDNILKPLVYNNTDYRTQLTGNYTCNKRSKMTEQKKSDMTMQAFEDYYKLARFFKL